MEKIILIGGGSHCKSIIDSIKSSNQYHIFGILDTKDKIGSYVNDIPIIGDDRLLNYCLDSGINNAFISVGSVGDPSIRHEIYLNLKKLGFKFVNIIDSNSIISKNIIIGEGNFIGKGTIINANVTIGNHCIVNTGSIIEHDCIIGDFCHIAPGAVLCGGVNIGQNSHIGANSTIIQNKNIGNYSLIGAGSVVVKDIGDNKKAYGNPCTIIQNP